MVGRLGLGLGLGSGRGEGGGDERRKVEGEGRREKREARKEKREERRREKRKQTTEPNSRVSQKPNINQNALNTPTSPRSLNAQFLPFPFPQIQRNNNKLSFVLPSKNKGAEEKHSEYFTFTEARLREV